MPFSFCSRRPPSLTLFPYTTLFRSRLPWKFEPEQTEIEINIGQVVTVYYNVTNQSARTTTGQARSEEHTSELQSRVDLVCRLLLEKKTAWLSPPRFAQSCTSITRRS